jgi:phenylalanyl-tRNA synthetase beta chain
MIVSLNLIKQFINPWQVSNEEVYDILNSVGLEVEQEIEYENIPGLLNHIVVGEVSSVEKIEGTDHLHKTLVNIGNGLTKTIVCGAPNVAIGQKVVVALDGALVKINNEWIKLKKTKIRGVQSEGMICAEDELGIGESHEGILVLPNNIPIGEKANLLFKDLLYQDLIYQIALTPNRADAASHLGVARDIYAAFKQRYQQKEMIFITPEVIDIKPSKYLPISIEIKNPEACPKYCGIVIDNVKVKDSTSWLKNYLNAWGMKSINNIVDISQYIMMEIGQPLHIFDYDKIIGNKLIIKNVEKGTKFKFLDGIERELSEGDLMICNTDEPMCMAGIMGGMYSGVTYTTKSIFIESAYFDPTYIRRSARRHNLHTEAAYRYERGVDYSILEYAIKRAAKLILEVAGGEIASDIVCDIAKLIKPTIITFSLNNINKFLSTNIIKDNAKRILHDLNFNLLDDDGDILTVEVPMAKVDVKQSVDIAEELIRIIGFDKIESSKRANFFMQPYKPSFHSFIYNLSIKLKAEGFTEIMNNSMESDKVYNKFPFFADEQYIKVLNPISNELNILRPSLMFGGLKTLIYNLNRKQKNLFLFEVGKVYKRNKSDAIDVKEKFEEQLQLAIWMTGTLFPENWKRPNDKIDLFDIKAIVENILKHTLNNNLHDIKEVEHNFLLNSFQFIYDNDVLSTVGEVRKDILRYFDIQDQVFYAEIYLETLYDLFKQNKIKYTEPNKFPIVRRDLSLLLNKNITFKQVKDVIYETVPKCIKAVNLFDVYEGKNLPDDKISYAISIIFEKKQATFTDEEIDNLMKKIIEALNSQLGIVLRG